MLVAILSAVGLLVVGFLIFVAMQATDYRVSRSASIAAPAVDVFGQVNDLHAMNEWSPWLEPDPNAKITYDGPTAGAGAILNWNGNNRIGEGRLTIVDSQPNDLIRIKLEFVRPFRSTAATEFTFKADGDRIIVTWTMTGQKNFMSKLFGLIMNMDKMIGGNFEKGLANLKSRLEGSATK